MITRTLMVLACIAALSTAAHADATSVQLGRDYEAQRELTEQLDRMHREQMNALEEQRRELEKLRRQQRDYQSR
jgi:hypothetical protein